MAQESFYGGRQGVSFVIVENYDSVEDMLAVFAQGGATTHEVNYGEYVIIDTPDKNDRTNGAVYRRGMRFDADGVARPLDPSAQDYLEKLRLFLEDPGKGAEYIGQIVGPQGSIREFRVGDYNPNPSSSENVHGGTGEYTPAKVVPGDENNGIKYSWENVLDVSTGEIQEYLIGFEFPYFKQEWTTSKVDAYEQGLIVDITPKSDEDPTQASWAERPFYRKYELKIPKGIKGDSVTGTGSIPTVIVAGSRIYDVNAAGAPTGEGTVLTEDLNINIDTDIVNFSSNPNQTWFSFKLGNETKSAYLKDGRIWHEGIKVTNYDQSSTGTDRWYDGGLFNYIEEMIITDSSDLEHCPADHLLVYYSDPIRRQYIQNPITWYGKEGYEDLGYVKGKPGSTPILGYIDSLDRLYDQYGNPIPPENLIFGTGDMYKGQVITLNNGDENQQIYAFNYMGNPQDQYRVGRFAQDNHGTDFIISPAEPPEMNEGGVWGFTEIVKNQGKDPV